MKIDVLYKDFSEVDNELHLIRDVFNCWGEEGNYTTFYKDYENDKHADLIIPTSQVCWIKPRKE